ncbi:phosphotransferase [Planotetraspora phitsanulokensis]|uniref:Aminoglycoside phosphotransferase domain-containing protein n=1 Tax=Planotetraspora phitsanulokensis TaxID=575192 RepID=A0A8J3UCQ6_9ACTN|nr:phosphotransferase [Planotetraspora phitsanulokensis]GII42101.1 hypothetical protein Pph01_71040 [Planotetraspora phitsanulokensis]
MAEFPRVARLDVSLVLRQLAEVTGIVLTEDGMCRGGQVGAAYVRWPDSRRSVLTWEAAGSGSDVRQAGELLETARANGVPAPRHELVEELPRAVAVVQELMPGSVPIAVGERTVESMIEVNRRCRGLLAGRGGLGPVPLFLREDGPGFCLHEPLARYDWRTARLLEQIEEVGVSAPDHLDGDDLVHFDFHAENVLVDAEGTVTGVVDWGGVSRGDGCLDLVTLRFDLARRAPELGRRLDEILAGSAAEEVVRACWAHMSLRLVDWSIRHLDAADVTAWVDAAETLRP